VETRNSLVSGGREAGATTNRKFGRRRTQFSVTKWFHIAISAACFHRTRLF